MPRRWWSALEAVAADARWSRCTNAAPDPDLEGPLSLDRAVVGLGVGAVVGVWSIEHRFWG